ncbi:MAG: methyltransferase domain-containing protein [Actinoallomurus sp.]
MRLWLAGICTAALVVGVGVSINQVLNNGVVNWGWLTAAMVFAGLGVATGGWATRERPLQLAQPEGVEDLEVSALYVRPREIAGDAEPLVDRARSLKRLKDDLRGRSSVVVVQGLQGAGKTTLVAKACLTTRRRRGGELRWFDCRESGDLDLRSLAATLVVQNSRSAAGRELRAALAQQSSSDPVWLAQTVMDYLSAQRTVLVIDNYHNVHDEGLDELVHLAERSVMPSTVLLISRRRIDTLHAYPRIGRHSIEGLDADMALEFLRKWGVVTEEDVAQRVWEAADGLPQAMLVLAGWKRGDLTLDGLRSIPIRTDDLRSWIEPLYQELTAREQEVARLVAFLHGPVDLGLIDAADAHPETAEVTLDSLCGRLIVTKSGETYRMHALVRDYVDNQISDTERAAFGPRVASHYQQRARELLLGVDEHPSYGKLYLEAHPDYVANTAQHEQLVDDLMARLAELSLQPGDGERILVLGSGNGIHDTAFAKYSLRITNLDIQPEIVKLGKAAAGRLNADIEYVVGDMTHPLDFPTDSMDAVFNIGSSFGYEGEDADNAAIFRHAARVLKPGRPFVFEYVNGSSWYERDPVNSETLPTGAVRTKYRIADRAARTSLDVISLRRPGEDEPEWFHHFVHYYTIETVEQMMRDAGLVVVRSCGAIGGRITGDPFDSESSDAMVIIALGT